MTIGVKSFVARLLARQAAKKIKKWSLNPFQAQEQVFKNLLENGKQTAFGEDHDLAYVKTHAEYQNAVPVRDYEGFRPYIKRIMEGEQNVLWPGQPIYFAKTSGTTSGTKYIPITRASISNHLNGARNALLNYIHHSGNASFVDGKMIFLSGSPVLETQYEIPTGRLSGIVNHHVPNYLKGNQLPAWDTNIIEDWEEKLEKIVEETIHRDMRLISGIPPWMAMYFDYLTERSGKKIGDLFPNLSLIVHGGVNYEPYSAKIADAIGRPVDTLETFPASEGFIAWQDRVATPGLLLILNDSIFYEFIPLEEMDKPHPKRLTLKQVELNVNYALVLSSNAGLWAYSIGDTVKFVSKNPYRIVVTGRVKHFISAFGEHVIAEEVDAAIALAAVQHGAQISEYTVAPQVSPSQGLPHHEWFVEFSRPPQDTEAFRLQVDRLLQEKNSYYADLIKGHILEPLHITPIRKNGFEEYMKSKGKLGGQNKLPRLSNDRQLADGLKPYLQTEA